MQLAVIAWGGSLGGAETLSVDLCLVMRKLGVEAKLVLVGRPEPLVEILERRRVPYVTLEMRRGFHVAFHGRQLARLVEAAGPDGALLQTDGYLAGALRAGGYRGRIVAVEHGRLLLRPWMPTWRRFIRAADQITGVWALDALVGVSHFVMDEISRHPHPARLEVIANGVDLDRFRPTLRDNTDSSRPLSVGLGGRLVPGKGGLTLLEALQLTDDRRITASVAGDGPQRDALEAAARRLGVDGRVRFCGRVFDMPGFWRSVDVAAVPSHVPHIEAFGIVAAEAMASGLPAVVSRNGGLPEVVLDGITGSVIDDGTDAGALARALDSYAVDPRRRLQHGEAARARAESNFDIKVCACSYVRLFRSLQ